MTEVIADMLIGMVLAILFGWAILSAVCQFRTAFTRRVRQWDSFFVIPSWTFFSPTPGTKDYRLVARVLTSDDPDWFVLEQTKPNAWYSFAFNSNKIRKKCLIDTANQLIEARNNLKVDPRLLWITQGYLSTLNKVLGSFDQLKSGDKFQFAIIVTGGYFNKDAISIVISSQIHRKD